MASEIKKSFLIDLNKRYGTIRKLEKSQSLYEIVGTNIRVYIRYSKLHDGSRTFFGLRKKDLELLEGYQSIICFLWENQKEPLLIPYSDYEDVFQSTTTAIDGQYKVHIFLSNDGTELYIAKIGRFSVEGNFGWTELERLMDFSSTKSIPDLSHSQVQTMLGSIGNSKGFDIWIPANDRNKLDWSLTTCFECSNRLPLGFEKIKHIIQEVDVVWIKKGANKISALFEVEHSTPIYSGLLRFNDIHLIAPNLIPRFSIVSNDIRRSLFVKQLNRPTFKASGLNEICTFLEYLNVFGWFQNAVSN